MCQLREGWGATELLETAAELEENEVTSLGDGWRHSRVQVLEPGNLGAILSHALWDLSLSTAAQG